MIKLTPFGRAIRKERLRCRTTLLEMARHLNMKPSELCAIETGERPEPKDFVPDVLKFFFEKRKEMKNKTHWPSGFTRGVPTEEGTYVLLCREGGTYDMIVREIHILDKETAEELDTTPGPNVLTLEEYWYADPQFFGVVGHMKLEGVSAFDLWNHIGKLEDELRKESK